MARKRGGDGVNKSEAIRKAIEKLGMAASANDVVAAVKSDQGVEVTAGLVYQVKNKLPGSGRGRRGRRGRRSNAEIAAAAAASSSPASDGARGAVNIGHILSAKAFAKDCGGIRKAKEALAALETLLN